MSSPANCATALAALRHLEQHPELPERLRELSLYARKGMTDRGLKIRESALTAPTARPYTHFVATSIVFLASFVNSKLGPGGGKLCPAP